MVACQGTLTKSTTKKDKGAKENTVTLSSDPYAALILMCKEQAKSKKTAFIRQVNIAPEPIVVCANDKQ